MLSPEFLAIGGGSSGYVVKNSLRFRASNSANLSRTPASSSSQTTYTFSYWFKRGNLNAQQQHFAVGTNSQNYFALGFGFLSGNDQLDVVWASSNVVTARRQTNRVFRDPSAWYHVVVALDTGNATANSRVRVYVNGVEETSFANSVNPTQSSNQHGWNTNVANYIGAGLPTYGQYHDGYMAEVNFIDGQALTPSSFGRTDAATGEWVPTNYSGSYGTNGFRLSFEDATSTTTIGYDSSGAANHMTTSGVSVTAGTTFDQSLDTPTTGYPTISPINSQAVVTISEANTAASYGGVANTGTALVSIPFPTTGKWYYEHTCVATGASDYFAGILLNRSVAGVGGNVIVPGTNSSEYAYRFNGQKMIGGTTSAYGASYTANDVIGVAFDADNLTLEFFKNGVSQGQLTGLAAGQYVAFSQTYNGGSTKLNFGARAFAYTPPTGFAALNTRNLPTPSIRKGDTYFDAELYTGNGTSQSVTGYGFQPDLVWIKGRNYVSNHRLSDAVRGVNNSLISNSTAAQDTSSTNYVTAFNANGFSVSSGAGDVNQNTQTYVAWAWKEGVTPGFDIMTYTGNGVSGRAVSHGLGVTPSMILVRNRTTAGAYWSVAHRSLPAGYNLLLSTNDAQFLPGNTAYGGISTFNSSTFTVVTGVTSQLNVNANSDGYVAYLWSEIEGFSKFGSYTGNGSTDGPFVWCGFRPKFVLVKNKDAAVDWVIQDAARSASNPSDPTLYPDLGNAEGTSENVDFLSNGFKPRNTLSRWNANANTFVFAAFADVPFKYARAR